MIDFNYHDVFWFSGLGIVLIFALVVLVNV